jgi:hypothetical protein
MADSTTSDAVVTEHSGNGHDGHDGAGPRRIFDPESFTRVTSDGLEVAGLYLYAKLDPLIDLACLVARDFFNRPHLYTELTDDEMPARLARLSSRVGYEEYYPSATQRRAMYEPVFGPCAPDGTETGDFVRLRDGLLAAASAFAEWSQATGIPMLRERVRTEHRPFREYLDGVTGATVTWARASALRAIAEEESYRVLRDASVIAVFGLTRAPTENWPFREDANGDKVVEEIGKALEPMLERRMTREKFSALQRVALRGTVALVSIMTFDESEDDDTLEELITRCYTWHAALKAWHQPVAVGSRNGSV